MRLALSAVLAVLALVLAANVFLWWRSRGITVTTTEALDDRLYGLGPDEAVIVVPGARVFPDGRPALPLDDRLAAAARLYHDGVAAKVLVSGDNRSDHYDEPTVMRRELFRAGIPLADITVDYAGLSTWDTCARAREIFGVRTAIFVTQERYKRRSGALCDAAGLDVTVFAVPNPPPHPRDIWLKLVIREPLAAVKGAFEVVTRPDPHVGGGFEGLPGSERPANPDPLLGE